MPTFAKLAADIRNGKDYEAEEAVQRLARNKSEEATKLLIEALGHESEHVSGAALDVAEKRPGEKLSRAIARAALRWKRTNLSSIRILKARGDDVSWAALIEIAKMADHKGRPFALKAVEKRCKRDLAFRSRRDVAKLMGIDASGGATGKKKAKKASTKKTIKKKKAAVKAGGQPLTEIPKNQAQAIQVIETLRRSRSPKAIDGLEAALEHKSLDVRWAAVLGIGAKSGKRPTTILVRVATTDRSPKVRWLAVDLLRSRSDAWKHLLALAEEDDAAVRAAALSAIERRIYRDKKARKTKGLVRLFTRDLGSRSKDARYVAAAGLRWLKQPSALEPLVEAADDRNIDVRLMVDGAIAAIATPAALAALDDLRQCAKGRRHAELTEAMRALDRKMK